MAGPIERARVLLPQIEKPRHIRLEQIQDGFRLVLLGYVLKLVVAENMAPFTKSLFTTPENQHGFNVLFGLYAAAFQILGDFAGYTNIARGISKMLGIELMRNFNQPYLATNPSDFWRRWHISLSTWLRDYLYIPLGGNRGTKLRMYRNLMLTMVLGGLWHGASLNFLVWGIFHGAILISYRLIAHPFTAFATALGLHSPAVHWLNVVAFFHITCFGWLLFFVQRLAHVKVLVLNAFQVVEPLNLSLVCTVGLFGGLTMFIETLRERCATESQPIFASRTMRLASYCAGVTLLVLCGVFRSSEFIYFQF